LIEHKHSIAGIAVYTQRSTNTHDTRYLLTDHLGSTDTVTDDSGHVIPNGQLSFDAHGRRRNSNWTDASTTVAAPTPQGYTGHEMDDEAGLINMNAREYDPVLGRFLSADTVVDSIAGQGLNRYSYVQNNPLSNIDPSGHSTLGAMVNKLKHWTANETTHILRNVAGVKYVGGLMSTGLLTTHFGYAYGWSTWDWKSVETAHVNGAIITATAAANGWVGKEFSGATNVFAHGIVGGTSSHLLGGNFSSGFWGGMTSAALSGPISDTVPGDPYGQAFGAGVVGGLAASAGGGSFEDGFTQGALAYVFNYLNHRWVNPTDGDVRGCDAYGCGGYDATRTSPDGSTYSHHSTDYVSTSGQDVVAVHDGTVSFGQVYPNDTNLRFVQITSTDGYVVREMYVSPADGLAPGDRVRAGDVIGQAQSLQGRYPGITDHIHVDIHYQNYWLNPQRLIY